MTAAAATPAEPWRDAGRPTAERVADLMSRLTTREKVAQLYGIWLGIDTPGGDVAPQQHAFATASIDWDEVIQDGLGQLTRPFGTSPLEPAAAVQDLAARQREVQRAGRFGIPALAHEECLTGLNAWQATIFPSPLCWGASFDPDLIERVGAEIGATMRTLGLHQGLAPVLDVARDLRWGRVEETIGEDPYLVGTIGSAYVRGLESTGIVATLKHFAGYSGSRAGRNMAPVSVGSREFADVYLVPFEMALRAGARSVMNSYTDVDGVPVAADPQLLTDVLRDRFGFTGTVVADYFSVAFLHKAHGVADGPGDAAAQALVAGIDVELPTVSCYGDPLLDVIESGALGEGFVDRAVERVLRQKCELGLLDPQWSPEPPAPPGGFDLDRPAARELAAELARRSIVLLANDGTLPLRAPARVAVVGPRADEPGAMLGCYSFPLHVGVHYPELPVGVEIPTVLEALAGDFDVSYAQGCPVTGGDDSGLAAAAQLAAEADVCVAVLGDRAGLFGNGTSGEGCDVADLRLPGRQEELLEALLSTGTPVVLVLLSGRPYELGRQLDRLAAVVCGFYPGEEGGPALADVLTGRAEPAGRLPIAFPGPAAGQPAPYLGAPLAQAGDSSTVDPTALFPFGHGLSYAPVRWAEVELRSAREWPTDGSAVLEVTLHNDSAGPTSEVVQVYLHDPVAEVSRPVQQLIAAARVDLPPATVRTVRIELAADLTSYTGRDGRRRVDAGRVELQVGASSRDIRARHELELTGPARVVGFDRVMEPFVSVLG